MDTPIAMHSVLNERTRKEMIVHILSLIFDYQIFIKVFTVITTAIIHL